VRYNKAVGEHVPTSSGSWQVPGMPEKDYHQNSDIAHYVSFVLDCKESSNKQVHWQNSVLSYAIFVVERDEFIHGI
jgi:hypothetical protein